MNYHPVVQDFIRTPLAKNRDGQQSLQSPISNLEGSFRLNQGSRASGAVKALPQRVCCRDRKPCCVGPKFASANSS